VHREIGAAVAERSPDRWSLIAGSSRRRLPTLLSRIAPIDLFIHDSDHTRYNMLLEMNKAWRALRPGGALVVTISISILRSRSSAGRFAASSTFARPSLSGPTSVGSTRKACLESC
jgi:hypothetical protein